MSGIKSQHSLLFEKLLAAHREALIGSLTSGVPQDYPAYRQLMGQIQGIDDALKFSQQADSTLSGEE